MLLDKWDSFTNQTANAFMYFLQNIDISNVYLSEIPQSNIKNELIQRSIPDELIFLKTLVETNQNQKIPSEIVWSKYCDYCSEEGCRIKKKRTFFILCSRYLKKFNTRINGKQVRCYLSNLRYFKDKVLEINHYKF